jgi:predicted secreted protein
MMELSEADNMAKKLKEWVEKLAGTAEGKAALDKVGLFLDPASEEE